MWVHAVPLSFSHLGYVGAVSKNYQFDSLNILIDASICRETKYYVSR